MKRNSLFSGAIWNILGEATPLAAAIFTIPALIARIGSAHFGFLSIAWAVIGYFSIFDLGLGRALTHSISKRIGTERQGEIPGLVRNAKKLLLGLGLLGSASLAAIAPWLATSFNIDQQLRGDAILAIYVLALGVPVVTITSSSLGVLTAFRRFDVINAVRIPVGVFNFLLPLAIAQASQSLAALILSLLCLRLVNLVILEIAGSRILRTIPSHAPSTSEALRELLTFGGWMTVTNVISPMMVYFDRFFIGSALSMSDVAFYTTPYLIVTKLWVISNAASTTLFPRFADGSAAESNLLAESSLLLLLTMLPGVLFFYLFSGEILTIWLGGEFANHSKIVLQILAIGVLANGIAQVPFAYLQGRGQPRKTAILHLTELPAYLLLLWLLLPRLGIEGAAISWSLRNIIDCILLYAICWRTVPRISALAIDRLAVVSAATAFAATTCFDLNLIVRAIVFATTSSVIAAAAYHHLPEPYLARIRTSIRVRE